MPNSKTERSRRARAATAAQWVKNQVDGGAYRLSVLLPAATADKLKAMAGRDKASIRATVIRLIDKEADILGGLRAGERRSRPAFKERFDVTSAISDSSSNFHER